VVRYRLAVYFTYAVAVPLAYDQLLVEHVTVSHAKVK
jgi:hypothetical protein